MSGLSRFVDKQFVSGGRFSHVYKAKEQKSGQIVALKVTTPEEDGPPHNSRSELWILNQLKGSSPNIISIVESFTADDSDLVMVLPYFAFTLTQYMRHNSTNLKRKFNPYLTIASSDSDITRSSQIPSYKNNLCEERSSAVLSGIVNGLKFLHSKGIIHRDIKPENIMFKDFDPVPVLIDFGISYVHPDNFGKEDPQKKICDVSTSIYRAPELIFAITDYSYGIDIWSLGIVMTLIYSEDSQPALSNDGYGDIRLISLLFKTFGTPSLDSWPEAKKSLTFSKLETTESPGVPTEKLLPRANSAIREIFQKMMIYESSKRLSAAAIYELLRK